MSKHFNVQQVGRLWYVADAEGVVSKGYTNRWWAEEVAQDLQNKADGPKVVKRKCLCCPREFSSSGAHHRMCDTCRARPAGLI